MPQNSQEHTTADEAKEPRGFGPRTRGLSSEYAHEQGWGLDTEERSRQPDTPQNTDGGDDYEYGARDFGDTPVNTAIEPPTEPMQNKKERYHAESREETEGRTR